MSVSKSNFFKALSVVLVVAAGFSTVARASEVEKLINVMPSDTIFFVGTSGGDSVGSAFDQTSLGKLWDHQNVIGFREQIINGIREMIKKEEPDPNAIKAFDEATELLALVCKRPVVFGIAHIKRDTFVAPAYPFIIVDAGFRKSEITEKISKIEALIPEGELEKISLHGHMLSRPKDDNDIYWGWVGNYFIIGIGDDTGELVQAVSTPTVKSNPLTKVPGGADAVVAHFDWEKLEALIKSDVGDDTKEFDTFLKNTGFDNL